VKGDVRAEIALLSIFFKRKAAADECLQSVMHVLQERPPKDKIFNENCPTISADIHIVPIFDDKQ